MAFNEGLQRTQVDNKLNANKVKLNNQSDSAFFGMDNTNSSSNQMID